MGGCLVFFEPRRTEMQIEAYLPALKKNVQVRGMRVREMDVLSDKRALLSGTAVDLILAGCCLDESIDISKILSADRNALFTAIRRATYGDEYEFNIGCPACGTRALYSVDLAQLPIIEGDEEMIKRQIDDPKTLHKFKFPICGKMAYWSFATSADEKERLKIIKNNQDKKATKSLLLTIKNVEGLKDEGIPLKVFVNDLEAEDAEAFADYYKECEPGVDDKIDLICENGLCNSEFQVVMPLDRENFFKRSTKKKKK